MMLIYIYSKIVFIVKQINMHRVIVNPFYSVMKAAIITQLIKPQYMVYYEFYFYIFILDL